MANYGNTNGATILTIPANRCWTGSVKISCATSGTAGDASMSAHPSVTISGSGASNWSDGDTVVAVALAIPPVNLTSLVGVTSSSAQSSDRIMIQARANPISLVLNLPSRVVGNAVATGELI